MMDTQLAESPESKLHFLDYWRIIRIRKAVILTVFLLVVLTTTVLTLFFIKEEYSSTVRISVEKEVTDVSGPLSTSQISYGYDPFWLQTQFETIQSSSVLNDVIQKLHLTEVLAKKDNVEAAYTLEEAYLRLRQMMKVRQSRNTSLIEISVQNEDKFLAAQIANVIADVYKESRLDKRRQFKLGGIKQLEQHLAEHETEVMKMKAEVDEMRKTNSIMELGDNYVFVGNSTTLDQETLRQIERFRIEAKADYDQYNTLLQKLTNLDREALRGALATAMQYPDQQLVALSVGFAEAEQKLTALLQDYGKESPEVKRAQSVVDRIEAQINSRVNDIVVGLQTKVAAAKAKLDGIESQVESAKTKETELAAIQRPYFDKKRELEELIKVQNALKLKIEQETIEAKLPISTAVELVDKAVPGIRPVKPNKILNLFLGVALGAILGVGLAFFIEYLDTSVKTIDDVERALQAPVLGVIPQNVGVLIHEGPESPYAEAYRVLRTNILFSRKDEGLNTITIVSGGVGEGKSTTLLNLATIFAQNGERVLVVDSDLRRPSLHKALKVSNSIGLTNYLLKQNSLEEVIQTTGLPSLDFMASGKLPSSSMGILSSEQMKNLIGELKRRYDFVFFDSPPIMGVSDASVLASEVDMALQVIQYRRYPQPMTIRAKQMIQKVGGNLVGIVLNNINMSQDESYYYYSGYYQDYYSSKQDDDSDVKKTGQQAKLEIKQKY